MSENQPISMGLFRSDLKTVQVLTLIVTQGAVIIMKLKQCHRHALGQAKGRHGSAVNRQ
jgi:hypothetical protein